MRRLIVFLIRMHLHVRKYEAFTFANQKSDNFYYFTNDALIKVWRRSFTPEKSHVSLNWLLDPECRIVKEGMFI